MRKPAVIRILAPLGAAALLLSAPVAASAQPMGSIDTTSLEGAATMAEAFPGSVANLAGGGLASVGLGDLGSAVAGGRCVAVDPAFGSAAADPLKVDVATAQGETGVARVLLQGGSWFTNTTGTFHWTNTSTNKSGEVPFGPFGGDIAETGFDVETGVGTVEWSVDGSVEGFLLSVGIPLAIVGSMNPVPQSTAPYSTCTGQAQIA